jgi:hypothetical protein
MVIGVEGGDASDRRRHRLTMPPAGVPKEAPGMKAYQVLMYQGNPVGEMYLAKEPLTAPKTPSQLLEEGLRKKAPALQNYQPIETLNLKVAGRDAVLHGLRLLPAASTVPFTGRVVVTVVNDVPTRSSSIRHRTTSPP